MIGAGIFVFPGIAAGWAGPAAAASFGIGAVIALLVALPTSELATEMPRSGGGYYFISRGMGALFGAIVGLSLWFGLMFAPAFYLVGFGHYATAVLAEAGVSLGAFSPVVPLALVSGSSLPS
jgi:amino acid transporter